MDLPSQDNDLNNVNLFRDGNDYDNVFKDNEDDDDFRDNASLSEEDDFSENDCSFSDNYQDSEYFGQNNNEG